MIGRSIVTLILLNMVLTGCTHTTIRPNDPAYSPVTPGSLVPPVQRNGTIFQAEHGVRLWDDKRAKRVGDVITVLLDESTTSTKSAKTEVDKSSSAEIPAPTVFGAYPSLQAKGFFPSSSQLNMENSWSADREFEGESKANQSNSLSGSITVTVSEVLPNGLLYIKGEKWLTLSRGEEYIRISGLIRQEDISPGNTVASTKIADARIAYSGTGELADANKMGWLSRVLNSPLWPF